MLPAAISATLASAPAVGFSGSRHRAPACLSAAVAAVPPGGRCVCGVWQWARCCGGSLYSVCACRCRCWGCAGVSPLWPLPGRAVALVLSWPGFLWFWLWFLGLASPGRGVGRALPCVLSCGCSCRLGPGRGWLWLVSVRPCCGSIGTLLVLVFYFAWCYN
jgi:hypothetical protein